METQEKDTTWEGRNSVMIRRIIPTDFTALSDGFREQKWDKPAKQFEQYWLDQEEGKRVVFVAVLDGKPVGYVTLLWTAPNGPFAQKEIPEICDFNVLIHNQGKGIGSMLLETAETLATEKSDTVCLGVGLHWGYGAAQRLYVKRGYLPDGSGVWYQDKQLGQYADCKNDDDLVLYLSKKLELPVFYSK